MDSLIPPEELLTRAQHALQTRKSLLTSLLRRHLQILRAILITPNQTAPSTALSQTLTLARLTREIRDATWLSLPTISTPSPSPPNNNPSSPPRRQRSAISPVPGVVPTLPHSFQTRTFYRGTPVNERRAPAAPWLLSRRPSSLSVAASTNSLETFDSALSTRSVVSPSPYPYGYANYRVDSSVSLRPSLGRTELRVPVAVARFFEPDEEALEIVRLRDNVFEIGRDGRIRRQTSGIGFRGASAG